MKNITKFLFVTVVLLFTTVSFAQGVTTASLGGQITDDLGEPLPGATVVIISNLNFPQLVLYHF